MPTCRVLIADDHPVFRYGLRALLESEGGFEVVGEAANGHEVVSMARELRPDIVLMDLSMPGVNGLEATRRILQTTPRVIILIITTLDDDSVFAAMGAGARGYILKGAALEETVRAIRAAANGEAIFSPSVAERVLAYFADTPGTEEAGLYLSELTERERDVLVLMAEGLTNNAIAERLALRPKTVRNYVSSILDKLRVANRTEAIQRAREAGLA